jgi:hypothetical protein
MEVGMPMAVRRRENGEMQIGGAKLLGISWVISCMCMHVDRVKKEKRQVA